LSANRAVNIEQSTFLQRDMIPYGLMNLYLKEQNYVLNMKSRMLDEEKLFNQSTFQLYLQVYFRQNYL